jgi:excisionase family DNA binding protein
MNKTADEDFLTVKEVSELLKMSKTNVYLMARDGRLPTMRLDGCNKVYFSKSAIIAMMRPARKEIE